MNVKQELRDLITYAILVRDRLNHVERLSIRNKALSEHENGLAEGEIQMFVELANSMVVNQDLLFGYLAPAVGQKRDETE